MLVSCVQCGRHTTKIGTPLTLKYSTLQWQEDSQDRQWTKKQERKREENSKKKWMRWKGRSKKKRRVPNRFQGDQFQQVSFPCSFVDRPEEITSEMLVQLGKREEEKKRRRQMRQHGFKSFDSVLRENDAYPLKKQYIGICPLNSQYTESSRQFKST